MTSSATNEKPKQKFKLNLSPLLPWLDVLAILAWGGLLFKYWFTKQLNLLIHPNYFGLVLFTSIALLVIGIIKAWQLLKYNTNPILENQDNTGHITIFPPGWASSLLILTAIIGFIIPPTVLTSQTAIQRGLTESLPLTRIETQSWSNSTKPEERSIIDWIRTLNAYPEPEAYNGQKAKVTGFVVHLDYLPENYLLISRFILTCCAVDAYPVGIPVKLNGNSRNYPSDTWLEISGEMMAETLELDNNTMEAITSGKRQLVLVASSIQKIPTPIDPYSY